VSRLKSSANFVQNECRNSCRRHWRPDRAVSQGILSQVTGCKRIDQSFRAAAENAPFRLKGAPKVD
jgi:hypothetical protein